MEMDTFKGHFNGALSTIRSALKEVKKLKTADLLAIKDLTDAELETMMGWSDHVRPYLLKVLAEMSDLPAPYATFKGALQDVDDAAGGLLGFEE